MSEEKGGGQYHYQHQHHDEEQPQVQYGTFQGVANYPPHQPAMGFPHPVPHPGHSAQPTSQAQYYSHGYQAVPGIFRSPLTNFFYFMFYVFIYDDSAQLFTTSIY